MRIVAPLAVAATALFATGIAVASTKHVMTLPLNDGSIVRVDYEGDVAPRISFAPAARPASAPVAIVDPFAQMDAIFAAMEQRHAAMMREIAALQARAGANPSSPVQQISAGDDMPAGGAYSFVSTTTTSSDGCQHSVQVTQRAGAAPQRVERSFGRCGGVYSAPEPQSPAQETAPATPTI